MQSQEDASSQPVSTCYSNWPDLARTHVDLQWLALTLVEIKFEPKSMQLFHHLATQCKLTQVNASWVTSINLLSANEIKDMSALKCFFATCVNLPGDFSVHWATQCKSLRKLNLWLLATTCKSVWPGLLYLQPSTRPHKIKLVWNHSGLTYSLNSNIYSGLLTIVKVTSASTDVSTSSGWNMSIKTYEMWSNTSKYYSVHFSTRNVNIIIINLVFSSSSNSYFQYQGSKFIFGFGSTCATRCKFLGALPKF